MASPTFIDEIMQELKDIPSELQREILDFTLFIKQRKRFEPPKNTSTPADQDWREFVGTLKDSPAFQDDPVAIQREMRDDWD